MRREYNVNCVKSKFDLKKLKIYTKIYHDKKTGIPIASFTDDKLNTQVSYSIGEVTNADVEMDLSQYTQIKD